MTCGTKLSRACRRSRARSAARSRRNDAPRRRARTRLGRPAVRWLALDLEGSFAFEHDVDLVVGVRLLPVRFRGNQDVDADLEAGRLVDDLIASRPRGAAAFAASMSIGCGMLNGRTSSASGSDQLGLLCRSSSEPTARAQTSHGRRQTVQVVRGAVAVFAEPGACHQIGGGCRRVLRSGSGWSSANGISFRPSTQRTMTLNVSTLSSP